MDRRDTTQEEELRFFATAPRPCSYLSGRTAISVFADPEARLSTTLYQHLALYGFRRSGNDLYVPACPGCSACVPVRIPVADFKRSRNQNKVWRRSAGIEWEVSSPAADPALFDLYRDYLHQRHPDGGMEDTTEEDYERFLTSDWCDSFWLIGKLNRRPVLAAVTDDLQNALSAVYTFFDPAMKRYSLGTLSILRQIELAKEMRRDWLYLGYWIKGSEKMHYKSRFRPLEGYRQGHWQIIDPH
jgi:arginyl-tRNA--protein-N-Asp/Glu arginylyltransferase